MEVVQAGRLSYGRPISVRRSATNHNSPLQYMQPELGSKAIHAPSTPPQLVRVSESLCQNLSQFKDLMKEYRKLDDSVTMRMNRNLAQFRDIDRHRSSRSGSPQDEACLHFWKELVANWENRTEIVNYCVGVVDASMEAKRQTLAGQDPKLDENRRTASALYTDEVKRNQMRNELTVETIIRQRSLDAFKSRCKFFEPPISDTRSRHWWDSVHAGH
ncbi:unnamed protein product [Rhizoctonia solani]|uniref:Caffeine-induced death protein 2 n=1 Tax=Rhizoctonia solani TaxID=456999 RepID=A0A8H3DGL0_9AGAM|nr:unnamed protein product [Rhizoctonia solani]